MNFSYNEYRNIIKLIQQFLPIMDFADITPKTEEFCVIRHDIEFSIDRAAKLAEIEKLGSEKIAKEAILGLGSICSIESSQYLQSIVQKESIITRKNMALKQKLKKVFMNF